MKAFEFKCVPANEPYRIVTVCAVTLEEAFQRATALWVRQIDLPQLLSVIDMEPQRALAFA